MKKLVLLITLIAIVITGFSQTKKETKGFLPKEFKKLYFGMSLEEFIKVKKLGMVELDKTFDFRISYIEIFENSEIKEIDCYFDAEGNIPFYEIIIDYHDPVDCDAEAEKLFGPPNLEGEWLFEREDSFDIKAWTFMNKLVIVGVLPGTEWDE